jgi:uncharacterized protein (TIGR02466 family)
MNNSLLIQGYYPVPVGQHSYDGLNQEEITYIRSMGEAVIKNEGNLLSENTYILNSPEMTYFKNYLTDITNLFFNEIAQPENKDLKVYITQSWVNFTKPGGHHHHHKHPNSYISGVFYLDVEDEVDEIFFHESLRSSFNIPTQNWNLYNSQMWRFKVKKNLLILFPSYLVHSVPKTTTSSVRMSISFNTFLKGNLGNTVDLTYLTI